MLKLFQGNPLFSYFFLEPLGRQGETNLMKKMISQDIMQLAIDRINGQGPTPVSPCSVTRQGTIRLCAAAAVASAGLRSTLGCQASDQFEAELAARKDREVVRQAYRRLGWDLQDCDAKMIYNDAQTGNQRRANVIRFLATWPVGG